MMGSVRVAIGTQSSPKPKSKTTPLINQCLSGFDVPDGRSRRHDWRRSKYRTGAQNAGSGSEMESLFCSIRVPQHDHPQA
jgi:hypothetical protein